MVDGKNPKKSRKRAPLTAEQIRAKRATPGMRIADALEIYPFGRNTIFELMHQGALPYTRLGRMVILSTAGLEKLVEPK
jgi:hypothetical protein